MAIPELEGLKVLVVDDDLDARELLVHLFIARGADVQQADAPRAALAILATQNPDVMISDIAMPDEDGYWLMQRVRALRHFEKRTVPAIAVTAFSRDVDRARALAAGFDRHMPKPLDLNGLLETVADLVRTRAVCSG